MRRRLFFYLIITCIIFTVQFAFCEDIHFLFGEKTSKYHIENVRRSADFYGLSIYETVVQEGKQAKCIVLPDYSNEIGAIVVSADIVEYLDKNKILKYILDSYDKEIPILISGVSSLTPLRAVSALPSNIIGDVVEVAVEGDRHSVFTFNNNREITRELAGMSVELDNGYIKSFHAIQVNMNGFDTSHAMECVISQGELSFFLLLNSNNRKFFIHSDLVVSHEDIDDDFFRNTKMFIEISPIMMFLRYALKDKCWHTIHDMANLTIDDPWLIEPYGHFSYFEVLNEMNAVGFHTTIAFVPWNYDRSRNNVVELIRENPEYFSICIHGNNHTHREFGKFESDVQTKGDNSGVDEKYQRLLIQALARMDKFKELTGLDYDKVMVFPHGIAPTSVLALLHRNNFLSTFNAKHIPYGVDIDYGATENLRMYTTNTENIASFTRYHVSSKTLFEQMEVKVAVDLFLDNPIIFYTHHDFFEGNESAFNAIASFVNDLQPSIKWYGLGDISTLSYILKLRNDNEYDVAAFTDEIVFHNPYDYHIILNVSRSKSAQKEFKGVHVDEQEHRFDINDSNIELAVRVEPKQTRSISINYYSPVDFQEVSLARKNIRINIIRLLSDFRDIILSKEWLNRFGGNRDYGYDS